MSAHPLQAACQDALDALVSQTAGVGSAAVVTSDGFEVASRLKADPATAAIPINMLSAMEGRGARVIGLESGAEEYLAKPFDKAELLARVHNLLFLRESAAESGRLEH